MREYCCAVCKRKGVRLYRAYGSFLREEEIFCFLHSPTKWFVPLVQNEEGEVWGYTSAPQEDMERWGRLPTVDKKKLYQVVTQRYMCCGLVTLEGKVIEAAPIMKWAVGKDIGVVQNWISYKGANLADLGELDDNPEALQQKLNLPF